MSEIIDTISLLVAAIAVLASSEFLLPWAGRRVSVMMLHGMRDNLYRIRREHPGAAKTLLFRDVEYVLRTLIRGVRTNSLPLDVGWTFIAELKEPQDKTTPSWRHRVYEREQYMLDGAERYLYDAVDRLVLALGPYLVTKNLVSQVLATAGILLFGGAALLAAWMGSWMRMYRRPDGRIAASARRVEKVEEWGSHANDPKLNAS